MKLETVLYKYIGFGNLSEYIVTKKISMHRKVLYEVECQSCTHGFKCAVLVEKVRGEEYYKYVNTITDSEDEFHEPFHTTYNGDYYFIDKTEALKALHVQRVQYAQGQVDKDTERLNKAVNELENAKAVRDSFLDNLKSEKE